MSAGSDAQDTTGTTENGVDIDARKLWIAGLIAVVGERTAALLLGREVEATGSNSPGLLTEPFAFIEQAIRVFILESLIFPVVAGTLELFGLVLGVLVFIFFGSDQQVGVEPGGVVGIVDIPLWIFDFVRGTAVSGEFLLFALLDSLNASLFSMTQSFGVLSLPIVAAIDVLLAGAVLWAGWAIVINIDIPFISVEGIIRTVSAPARFLIRILT